MFIENVGNLICPALFDLGERAKVVILSVTEGEDKPIKYPHMFRACQLMLLNKIDLLPHLRFDVERCVDLCPRDQPGYSHHPGLRGNRRRYGRMVCLAERRAECCHPVLTRSDIPRPDDKGFLKSPETGYHRGE